MDEPSEREIDNDLARKKFPIIGMEPVIVLVLFSYSLSATVYQNQVIYQTCTYHFGYNESDCAELGKQNVSIDIQNIESIVQPYVADMFMVQTIIKTIIPVLMSVFIGPWSDKYGRIPITLASILGYFLCSAITTVILYISMQTPISPWMYTIADIPMSLLGGNCGLFAGIFSYASDTSSAKNRALKMALLEASLYGGLVFGLAASSYVLELTSTLMVFVLATFGYLLAIIYICCFVEESIDQSMRQETRMDKFFALFDVALVSNMFTTCFKRRENWNRAVIWLAILSIGATVFVWDGSMTVFYLFIREKFNWTIQQYTFYTAGTIVIQILGNIVGLLLLKKLLQTPDSILGIIGFASACVNALFVGLANDSWQLWTATVISILRGIATPMSRAIMANALPANEIGAVYSLTASIENVAPLASAPLYSYVYGKTINDDPGAFNFISAGIFAYCTLLLVCIFIIQRRYSRTTYETLISSD